MKIELAIALCIIALPAAAAAEDLLKVYDDALQSDPQMRGRVMALWAIAFLGSTTIGGPVIGFIGQNAGARWGLATGGLAALAAGAYGVAALARRPAQHP